MFRKRWNETDDGVWETIDNEQHKNGALIFEIGKDAYAVFVFRIIGDLRTITSFPKTLLLAQDHAEKFIDRLNAFEEDGQ